jgi:protein-S-isoprenylcysteine O-methyltransferase
VGGWIVLLVVGALLVGAYTWRIHTEEAMLLGAFGDQYRQYQRRTRRLIPFVY